MTPWTPSNGRPHIRRAGRRPTVDEQRAQRWDDEKTARIVWLRRDPADVAEADREHAKRGRRALLVGAILSIVIWAAVAVVVLIAMR